MIENGTLLQNRYLIERQIGAGGMGAVYLGIDQRFDSRVAIKRTFFNDEELRNAFEREARLLNGLHHPVLPHVSDYFSEGNNHFLVMEYIEGDDMSEILKRGEKFAIKTVFRWIDNLLDALDYLHSQDPPIIHRDIKPQNLKLTPRGDIVLLDFGLAKLNSLDTTGVKSVFGYSRKYSPLEQIQGTGTDARSDVFSLGATAYHLLTTKPPLDTLSRAASIIAGNPDPLEPASAKNAEISPAVAEVLQTALALNPDLRFASANAFRDALKHAVNPELTATEVSKEAAAAIEQNNQNLISPEPENFPALEAFAAAAEDENSSENESSGGKVAAVPIQISFDEDSLLNKSLPPLTPIATETATETQVSRRSSDRRSIVFASVAAVLIWGGLAVWLAANGIKSSEKQADAPIVKSTPTPAAKAVQAEIVSPSPQLAIEETPEIPAIPQTSQPPVSEKTVAKKTTRVQTEEPEETALDNRKPAANSSAKNAEKSNKNAEKSERAAKETQPTSGRSAVSSQKTAARKDKQSRVNDGETRPRVVKATPPASSIERVLTGKTPKREERRDARRREETTEAEREALRRRRAAEVQRINRKPIPRTNR